MNAEELKSELSQYYGGDTSYIHPVNRSFLYTEGMRSMFLNAGNGSYWLADVLATEPAIKKAVLNENFLVGSIRSDNGKATVTVSRDSSTSEGGVWRHEGIYFQHDYAPTDFPNGLWKFYLSRVGSESGPVEFLAMLPSEY